MTSVPSLSHPLHPELPDGAPPPAPPSEPAGRLGVPAWVPFAAAFVALIVTQIVGAVIIAATGMDATGDVAGVVLTVLLDLSLVVCSIAAVWRLTGPPSPAMFALRPAPVGRSLLWIIGTYVAVAVVSAIVAALFGTPPDQDIVTELKSEDSVPLLVAFAAMTCVLAPLAEEFFFRGFLFRVLAEKVHFAWAAIVAGLLFGLVHLPGGSLESVAVLGALGAMLCLMVYYTASLLPCIIMHASFNSLAFGATKELPWWGYLLVLVGSVTATLVISLLATRLGRRAASGLVPA
jgi:membrane protease YdiL (CAAX protease family)